MDRREFIKAMAALGVTVTVPSVVTAKGIEAGLGRGSALIADNLGMIGSWEPVFMLPTYTPGSDYMVLSESGATWTVPGDADTLAEAIELADVAADEWHQWKWSVGDGATAEAWVKGGLGG